MLKIKPNKKNIGAEIVVNLKEITNKDTQPQCQRLPIDRVGVIGLLSHRGVPITQHARIDTPIFQEEIYCQTGSRG